MFGNAGREYMEKYGVTKEQLAKIAMKNHNHSANNPYSQFRDTCTLVIQTPELSLSNCFKYRMRFLTLVRCTNPSHCYNVAQHRMVLPVLLSLLSLL